MFTQSLEITLNLAYNQAQNRSHEFLTVEHLLLALLDNPDAVEVLIACRADVQRLRSSLGIFIEETTPQISGSDQRETQPTLGFQRVLQRSIFQVQSSGKTEVNGANILASIFSEQESQAVYFLTQENMTKLDVINYITHGAKKLSRPNQFDSFEVQHPESMVETVTETSLEKFTVNLNEQVKLGKIDPLIGRTYEVNRAMEVLSRRKKNNPLLVGEAGVGKTAIAEGLAWHIVHKNVPKNLLKAKIYTIDLGVMLAGTKYRGDFEKRFKVVLKELKNIPEAIIFIDEIHSLVGAGAASGGSLDAANLIKPLLTMGDLKCMGATTYQEYRNIFNKDKALARRFQKIDIEEPSVVETIEILQGLKPAFEKFHNVKFSSCALKAAAVLSDRFISDRFLPDKAIDVIDEAGAVKCIKDLGNRTVSKNDVEAIVAKIARIPAKNVSSSDKNILQNLERDIKTMVFGQDEAVDTICNAIKVSRSGLRADDKTIGSFLFAGPTGVGKTEVAVQLANSLSLKLLRFDMSEYMESHSVSQLIGAPAGYVGYDQGGLLTDAVIKNPHAVLLLDEIEKAHQDIYNILLQVMDHGSLLDNNGREVDFRHVILIMTSNCGAMQLVKNPLGFNSTDSASDSLIDISREFSPEFRNRLDSIIQFKHLDANSIVRIVDKFLTELEVQIESKNLHLKVNQSAKDWLAEHGIDKTMGARPMSRLIHNELKMQLADKLLFGDLARGDTISVGVKKDHLWMKTLARH